MRPINESITAIISDFAGESSVETLQGFANGRHSFSDIIVVRDYGVPGATSNFSLLPGSTSSLRIKNITRYPGVSPSRDFCLALSHVETPYFGSTNVFRLPTNLAVMDDDEKVMVPVSHRLV